MHRVPAGDCFFFSFTHTPRSATRGICVEGKDSRRQRSTSGRLPDVLLDAIGPRVSSLYPCLDWCGHQMHCCRTRSSTPSPAVSCAFCNNAFDDHDVTKARTNADNRISLSIPVREACAYSLSNSVLTASTVARDRGACRRDDHLPLRKTECIVAFGKKSPLLHQHDDR